MFFSRLRIWFFIRRRILLHQKRKALSKLSSKCQHFEYIRSQMRHVSFPESQTYSKLEVKKMHYKISTKKENLEFKVNSKVVRKTLAIFLLFLLLFTPSKLSITCILSKWIPVYTRQRRYIKFHLNQEVKTSLKS